MNLAMEMGVMKEVCVVVDVAGRSGIGRWVECEEVDVSVYLETTPAERCC